MKIPKVIRRVLIILLLIIVLAEIAFLLINWRNMIDVYTVRYFTINSTTGLLLLTLVTHNAYAKVIITIENPSNETLLIHLSNGTTMILKPLSRVKLTYLSTPISYYSFPICSGALGLISPNASITIPFTLNSMVNPIVIYENVTSLRLLRQVIPVILTQIKHMSQCAVLGTYLLITTANGEGKNAVIIVTVSKLVIVV